MTTYIDYLTLQMIKMRSLSHVVYEGLTNFKEGKRLATVLDVPGVVEGATKLTIN
jgi:hypothetical protein